VVDRTPPLVGRVRTGASGISCVSTLQKLVVRWEGVVDEQSPLVSFAWAIGSDPFAQDVRPFELVAHPETGVLELEGMDLPSVTPGMVVYVSLRVTNGAAGVTVAASPGVRIVEGTCNMTFSCLSEAHDAMPLPQPPPESFSVPTAATSPPPPPSLQPATPPPVFTFPPPADKKPAPAPVDVR